MSETAIAATSADEPRANYDPLDAIPYLLDITSERWNQRISARLAQIGLSFEQWSVLLVTARRGPMNIRELSNATLVPHSTIGRWLNQMETDGLVKRRALPSDQRAVEISITQKGRNMFLRALPGARSEYEAAIQEFTPAELDMLTDFLQRLRTKLFA